MSINQFEPHEGEKVAHLVKENTPAAALVAGSPQSQDKNVLPSALLDRMAAELNKIERLTTPVLLQCGGTFAYAT